MIGSRFTHHGLLNAVLDDVTPLAAGREGTVPRREGFAFLSSADSTTPVHIDLENNFLLQIYGAKEMNVGRFENEETVGRSPRMLLLIISSEP